MKKLYLLLPLLLLISACEQYEQDSFKEYVVVESYAVANDSLPDVFVRTTARTDQEYNASELVLNNADVQIVLLDDSDSDEEVFGYNFNNEKEKYVPLNQNHRMLPTRTYRLDVSFDDRPEVIQTSTTIPDDFEVINEIPETIVYQGSQFELVLSPTEKTQPQNIFVFTAIALHARLDNMTPFYFAALDDDNVELSDFQVNSSGLINEESFSRNDDETIRLKFPWIGVAFYGETRIVTQSVDKNIADLVRSQNVQLGGSTLSPGEIPNLIYNVEGGIGVFGSLATDTVSTIILNPF
ncbi:MAG: DUF4249 family protein [Balneolaceae bacterium]|nr:DUF4249 family protein [Balneolaceae bacterium]